ncbi:5-(carboxyamino)imidazole ribonucleotide mutase [Candidatus Nitrosocosmicus hydrocola]|uniref:5-(carboxyamino)imidazole ribonucleotide mutase n=1 Tax=Candidatus Nitrosocosmicus hydrocola TaxID=1826872 RepID=UPI0011E5F301
MSPKVGVIMGSDSDLEVMNDALKVLIEFEIPYEVRIVSAHRTPHELLEYAESAKSKGINIIISGAGGAAHLPGMVASFTSLPVIGVPICSPTNPVNGMDSLFSIVQMPPGVPVATVSINGAKNAGILACSILSISDPIIFERIDKFKNKMRDEIKMKNKKIEEIGHDKYLEIYKKTNKGK